VPFLICWVQCNREPETATPLLYSSAPAAASNREHGAYSAPTANAIAYDCTFKRKRDPSEDFIFGLIQGIVGEHNKDQVEAVQIHWAWPKEQPIDQPLAI